MSPQRKVKPAPVSGSTGLDILSAAAAVGQTASVVGSLPLGFQAGTAATDPNGPGAFPTGPPASTAPQSSYDALADVYGLGVTSSTRVPIRYRPTQSQIVSTLGPPSNLKIAQSTVGGQMQRLYSMAPAEVAQWQRKLFEGGFYGTSIQMSDIMPGVVDLNTSKAWQNALITAARYSSTGHDTTIEDVIDMTAQAVDYQGTASGGGGGGGTYSPTRLTDPASLKAMADQISVNLIGRRLTEQEKTALVTKVHGAEAGFYDQVRGQAPTLTDVDPQAQIQQNIQQDFKSEYDATNVAHTYDIFSQILAGSGR